MTGAGREFLERPVWSALTTRHAAFARGAFPAIRYDPEIAMFAATADSSRDSHATLARLVLPGETIAFVEPDVPPMPAAFRMVSTATCWQMIAEPTAPTEPDDRIEPLTEADVPELRALVALTRPGPFFARTHEFGGFVGIREQGRLIGVAGTRMALPGYREVSGVCTHPDARGRGLASRLIRHVASGIMGAGERAFLHSYADNRAANALYEALGFVLARTVEFTVVERH